jgi:glycosyltransferase involved in cell wall biosynthesis
MAEPRVFEMDHPKIIIVLPAYNAEKTLEMTINAIPQGAYDQLIVVDDYSRDNTVSLSQKLGLKTIRHDRNKGYGANQKTCYKAALEAGADIVVMLHPDYQYEPKLVPFMTGLIKEGICDVILGSRIRTRREALEGGMPVYKYFMNRLLTLTENIVFGTAVSELHTGYRAYSRQVLETVPFEKNSDDFVFDQHIIAQIVFFKFRMGEIPVPTKYFEEASSISLRRSMVYGLSILSMLARYILHRLGVRDYDILNKA